MSEQEREWQEALNAEREHDFEGSLAHQVVEFLKFARRPVRFKTLHLALRPNRDKSLITHALDVAGRRGEIRRVKRGWYEAD